MDVLIDNTAEIFRLIGLPIALALAARDILTANRISFVILLMSKLLEKMSISIGNLLRESLNLRYCWTDLSIFILLLHLKPPESFILAFLKQNEVSPTLLLDFYGLMNIFMLFQMKIFSWLCKDENKEIFLYVGPVALILTCLLFYYCSANFWGIFAALFAWGTQRGLCQLALTLLIKRHFPPAVHGRMFSILSLTINFASFISAISFDYTNATMFISTILINILTFIWVLVFRKDLTDTQDYL